jgi:SAM-dependent methyltransferase
VDSVGVDLTNPMADQRVDLTAMPFADESFDAVLCMHVLEHIPDDKSAMAELFRVLRPGGWAVLQVPLDLSGPTREDLTVTDPKERLRLYGQEDHVRLYGDDYPERLSAVGFRVDVDEFVQEVSPALRAVARLDDGEALYVARKPA